MKKEPLSFSDSLAVSTRLTKRTHDRLTAMCNERGITMWKWLERVVVSALDCEDMVTHGKGGRGTSVGSEQ